MTLTKRHTALGGSLEISEADLVSPAMSLRETRPTLFRVLSLQLPATDMVTAFDPTVLVQDGKQDCGDSEVDDSFRELWWQKQLCNAFALCNKRFGLAAPLPNLLFPLVLMESIAQKRQRLSADTETSCPHTRYYTSLGPRQHSN